MVCPLRRRSTARAWQHQRRAAWQHLRVVTVLALLGVLLVLFVAAVVATREDQAMADAAQDLPDLGLPVGPLEPQDVAAVRFSMAPRGYRMSEVDAVLERLAAELADRDRQLAELVDEQEALAQQSRSRERLPREPSQER